MMASRHIARLLIECPDARGVVAAVAMAVADAGGNILEADQHTDPDTRQFFMRVEFEPEGDRASFEASFAPMAEARSMVWRLRWRAPSSARRVAVLCSKETHCLSDLLWRWQNAELADGEVALVAGNHEVGRPLAEAAGVTFRHAPIDTALERAAAKRAHEDQLQRLLEDAGIELVVLARYMQVLSAEFVSRWNDRVINIHHSFLPAFAGARPYHQAFERGVKLIGATAHYATAELDDGPIIAQRTAPVSHRDSVSDLVRKGRDLERVTLAEAVRLHLEDKVLVSGRKTVVFD